jgi:tRNA dimethylallyltransferase
MPLPILIICGPTAVGKTQLALKLAARYQGELLAADSRQVYRYLDIATNKDLPSGSQALNSSLTVGSRRVPYYSIDGIKLWGYDLAGPDEWFSVAEYSQTAHQIIREIHRHNHLPIIVGGTGFYLKAITNPPATMAIPPNPVLRQQLETLTVQQLQTSLKAVNPEKFNRMNPSDSNNPRRLVRALEIAGYSGSHPQPITSTIPQYRALWLGLTAGVPLLKQRIKHRLETRANDLLTAEINRLTELGIDLSATAATSIGYRQWQDYLKGKISREEAKTAWYLAEIHYLQRQVTWFKKQPQIKWFDINSLDFNHQIESVMDTCYSKGEIRL